MAIKADGVRSELGGHADGVGRLRLFAAAVEIFQDAASFGFQLVVAGS